nr:DegT/DnrJ/EryC1/StrS family aminotransferase [Nitrospiraceae bacterium]
MGEGGALLTDDPALKRIIESFRDWGRDCWCPSGRDDTCKRRFQWQLGELPRGYDHKYTYSHFGYNLKVTDMQAAVGCAQLEKLPAFIEARKRNFKRLYKGLKPLEGVFVLPKSVKGADPSWFGFLLTVKEDAGFTRDAIVRQLEKDGIQTRMLFAGNIVKHPLFDELRREGRGYRVAGTLDTTDSIMKNTFWVGVYPGLDNEMIDYMISRIAGFADWKKL